MIFLNSLPYLEEAVYLTNRLGKTDIPTLSISLQYYHVFVRALYLDGLISTSSVERLLALKRDLDVLCNGILNLDILEAISPEPICDIIYVLRGYFFGKGGEILPIVPSMPNTSLICLLSLQPQSTEVDLVIDCRSLPGTSGIPFDIGFLREILDILKLKFDVHLVLDNVSTINDTIVVSPRTDKWGVTAFMNRFRDIAYVSGGSLLRIENTRLNIMNSNMEWFEDLSAGAMYKPPSELDYLKLAFPRLYSHVLDILNELWTSSSTVERLFIERLHEVLGDLTLELYYKLLRYGFILRLPSPGGYVVVPSNKGLRSLLNRKRSTRRGEQ